MDIGRAGESTRDGSLAGDFDLWMRFRPRTEIYSVELPLAGFRRHATKKPPAKWTNTWGGTENPSRTRRTPARRLTGQWLKMSAKLLRFFKRRHAYAARQQGFQNRCVFSGNGAGWTLKDH